MTPFEWTDEQEPLIEDNAPDPQPATYLDILTEMPGVILESSVPAMEMPPPSSEEEQMAAAVDNAGIALEFEEFKFRGRGNPMQHHARDMQLTHNHINIVPAKEGEITTHEDQFEDEVQGIPDLPEEEDSSDNETYVDKELEDIELLHNATTDSDEEEAKEEETVEVTRSVQQMRPPKRYEGINNISVSGMHFMVNHMHFTVGATDLNLLIPVYRDKINVLGVIITQLSLREGLK